MRHRRRIWFVAPLVAVAPACSSGHPKAPPDPASWATVRRNGTACTYDEPMSCPPNVMCNPPPPTPIECPPELGEATRGQLGGTGPGTCGLVVPPCGAIACAIPTACPVLGHDLVTLRWAVNPGADGTACTATAGARTDFSMPPAPVTIECPAVLTDRHGFIVRERPDAACVACAKPPCEATAPAVACPDPK